ncbi:MAG: class I SAM-dependent methyltransferase [Candidatus Babeliales bacterium]
MEYMGFNKYKDIDKTFHKNIQKIFDLDIPKIDFIHQFPVFVGHVNLARYLFFYDLYKKVHELSGHIADIGTWKGSSFFFMSKLVRLFESYALTQVHGFDWFKGMQPSNNDDKNQEGLYADCTYENILKLIDLQQLNDISIIHKLDITKDLDNFFKNNIHLRFKMVFIDCGIAQVLEKALEHFWPRLVNGGIIIMDHYNAECSPSESTILEKYIGKNHIQHLPYNRQPTAYVIKLL